MTPYEVIRKAIPDADDDLCSFILWGRTGFPAFWKTNNIAREIFEAARRFSRALANKRQLCDFCDNQTPDGRDLCPSCAVALGRDPNPAERAVMAEGRDG